MLSQPPTVTNLQKPPNFTLIGCHGLTVPGKPWLLFHISSSAPLRDLGVLCVKLFSPLPSCQFGTPPNKSPKPDTTPTPQFPKFNQIRLLSSPINGTPFAIHKGT